VEWRITSALRSLGAAVMPRELCYQVSPGAGSSIHRDSWTSYPTHLLLCFNGAVTLAWYNQASQRTWDGSEREEEASQVLSANQGVAFPTWLAARCYHGTRDVTAGCLWLICRSALGCRARSRDFAHNT
jgi:hypothetical protein